MIYFMKPAIKKIFYSFILLVYVTINLLSVFHHHKIKFSHADFSILYESQSNPPLDPFMGSDSNCQLLQFSQTSYLDSQLQNQIESVNFSEVQFVKSSLIHFSAFEGWSSNLRAPPSLS